MAIKVFDFFSGCGGTSCGFREAGLDVVAGFDVDADAAMTFQQNFPEATFFQGDIRTLPTSAIAPLLYANNGRVLFSGCAPCQPFSKQNSLRSITDSRRTLLDEFWRFVAFWRPDYVFIENVPGMQKPASQGPFPCFVANLESVGYSVAFAVMPALWFGVPQTRERLVLLATRHGNATLPTPTHGKDRRAPTTVRDWIQDLPCIEAGEQHSDDRDHHAATLSRQNLKRIRATPEGGGREAWPKSLWLECHKNHKGHSDVYGRLAWDRPAAGLTTKCISYSNGRFGHPEQNRAISLREAACLQTFPKSYRFYGGLQSRARQVGNAVPPIMAKAFGRHIVERL